MRVENGRKRASSEGGQSNPDRAESGSIAREVTRRRARKEKKKGGKQASREIFSFRKECAEGEEKQEASREEDETGRRRCEWG